MQMARTHLASSDAERRTPQMSGANPGAAAERLAGAEAVQPAIAI